MKNIVLKIFTVLVMMATVNCSDDFLDLKPTASLEFSKVFSNPEALKMAMQGVYNSLVAPKNRSFMGMQYILPMSLMIKGDLVQLDPQAWYGPYKPVFQNSLIPNYSSPLILWRSAYKAIEMANSIINADLSKLGDDVLAARYKSECKVIRALVLSEIVRLYGHAYVRGRDNLGVPIVLKNTPTMKPKRNTVGEVYDHCLQVDLSDDVIENLETSGAIKVTKNLAYGLRARLYLDMEEYTKARDNAKLAYANTPLMDRETLAKGLSKGTPEDIFRYVNTKNAYDRYRTVASSFGDPKMLGKDTAIYKEVAESFSDDDIRKTFFIAQSDYDLSKVGVYNSTIFQRAKSIRDDHGYATSYSFYGKYPRKDVSASSPGSVGLGDFVFMRASEMVLIAAECEARLGNDADAQTELFKIQERAISSAVKSTRTGQLLIDEILEEKKKELLAEGNRYRDLLRLNKGVQRPASTWAKSVQNVQAGDERSLFPIPQDEIDTNPNMVQNEAYK